METKITRQEAASLIENSNGTIFRVTFVKRSTGEIRDMLARLGTTVSKGLVGGSLPYNPKNKNLITAYLMNGDPSYEENGNNRRMIDIEGIISISTGGQTYVVED